MTKHQCQKQRQESHHSRLCEELKNQLAPHRPDGFTYTHFAGALFATGSGEIHKVDTGKQQYKYTYYTKQPYELNIAPYYFAVFEIIIEMHIAHGLQHHLFFPFLYIWRGYIFYEFINLGQAGFVGKAHKQLSAMIVPIVGCIQPVGFVLPGQQNCRIIKTGIIRKIFIYAPYFHVGIVVETYGFSRSICITKKTFGK